MSKSTWDWEQALWAELDQLTPTEQLIRLSDIITYVVRDLLVQLGERRRDLIVAILDSDGSMDPTRLAEMIGARRTAIARLAGEGRRRLREQARTGVDDTPPPQ